MVGKKVKRLRQEGLVPAVVYGHSAESISIQMRREDLAQALRRGGRTAVMKMKVGREKPISVTIKQLHVHPTSGQILHADFYRIAAGEKLKMRVPLHFEGEAPVLKSHEAALVRAVTDIAVECLPGDLPTNVPVDLTVLIDLNHTLRVGDLAPIDKVVFLDSPSEVIVSVVATAREAEVAKQAVEAAEGAAPAEETAGAGAGAEGSEEEQDRRSRAA